MSLNLMHTMTNVSILTVGSCILQLVEALQLCQSPLDVFEPNTHHDKHLLHTVGSCSLQLMGTLQLCQ